MAPNTKAAINLITNGGFEDPLATGPDTNNWEGGTRVNIDSYTGSYSLYIIPNHLIRQRMIGLSDGSYIFSMMYKPIIPATMGFQVVFYGNIRSDAEYVGFVRVYGDSVTEYYNATGAVITIMSDGWRNLVFNISLSRIGYSAFTDWRIKFPDTGSMNGFIDDVWLSTTGAISYYSGVSLSSPADDSTASSLDVNFTYTPSMNNTIVNASLWLNSYNVWQRVTNTTTVTNGTLNNFTYALPYQGVYLWNVEVWDSSNYFFAPSNYTLTVQSGTAEHGSYFDPCESTSTWLGWSPLSLSVDNSDFVEGVGSMNLSAPTATGTAEHERLNMTFSPDTSHVLGFYIKFNVNATGSNITRGYIYVLNNLVNDMGWQMFYNGTHFKLQTWWNIAEIRQSAWTEIDASHWYWIEVEFLSSKCVVSWVDGVCKLNATTVAYGFTTMNYTYVAVFQHYSLKLDAIRLSNSTGFPPILVNTISVTSNPELNAFFSMSTNVSTLLTETLCVDGLVNETFSDLGHVGASPWLDTQDDNTSYVQTNLATATYDQYYTFNDTTLLTISSSIIHYRVASFPFNTSVWLVVDTYFWNGLEYVQVNNFIHSGDWATLNSSALTWQLPQTPDILNQLRLKVSMHLNQQVSGITYMGRLSAVWIDVSGYGNPEGAAVHQTPYSFNPTSNQYVFTALNSTLYLGVDEYRFSGFSYDGGSYNGSTLIFTSLSGINSIVLEYSIVVSSGGAFLIPFMFLFWVIGLFCLFLSPIYAIDKIKKREYIIGLVGGVIFFAIGFGLFIGGLWGITI